MKGKVIGHELREVERDQNIKELVDKSLGNFFCKEPERKYFQLRGPNTKFQILYRYLQYNKENKFSLFLLTKFKL